MKSEWKTLCDKAENLVVTPAFILAIPWLNGNEKIILQLIAKNKDGYHPSIDQISKESGISKRNVIKIINRLAEKKVLIRNDLGKGKPTLTEINYDALKTSDERSLVTKDHQCRKITRTSDERSPVTSDERSPLPKKKPNKEPNKSASPNSMRLAITWYDKSPPSEKHDKETLIKKWALEIDKAQRLTGYSDDQMRTAIEFRNRTPFWVKNCTKPNRLHPLRDGTRKIVTIYDQAAKDSPPQKSEFKEATTADFF